MNNIIETQELDGTFAYLDNIIIVGKNQKDHDLNLNEFLRVAHKLNLFSANEISVLGYSGWKGKMKPDPNRFQPLIDMPIT